MNVTELNYLQERLQEKIAELEALPTLTEEQRKGISTIKLALEAISKAGRPPERIPGYPHTLTQTMEALKITKDYIELNPPSLRVLIFDMISHEYCVLCGKRNDDPEHKELDCRNRAVAGVASMMGRAQ